MKHKKHKRRTSVPKALKATIEQAIADGKFDGKHRWTR